MIESQTFIVREFVFYDSAFSVYMSKLCLFVILKALNNQTGYTYNCLKFEQKKSPCNTQGSYYVALQRNYLLLSLIFAFLPVRSLK